jgi:zinc/manganese transport system substrate-binding protein
MKNATPPSPNGIDYAAASHSAPSNVLRLPARGWKRAILSSLAALALAAFGHGSAVAASSGKIIVIGVESEYADVIAQIGGQYVEVSAIETDPNTDPHSFEASPKIASQIAAADLIVENGIGYDSWADKIMAAAPNAKRKLINAQQLLGLPDTTPNPHLWYDPKTMPAIAKAVAAALSELQPAQASYFQANVEKFDASLKPWYDAIASFKAQYAHTPVAVTEPVADYLLQSLGADIETPFTLEAAIMNGTDPSPQDVTTQNDLLASHKVKLFAYNQQVTDALTQTFLDLAKKNGVPVVGVYETMPSPGFTYQTWMVAETAAVQKALTDKVSTEALQAGK